MLLFSVLLHLQVLSVSHLYISHFSASQLCISHFSVSRLSDVSHLLCYFVWYLDVAWYFHVTWDSDLYAASECNEAVETQAGVCRNPQCKC